MKKNLHVIQINGIRGMLIAGFIISCLIAGFIAFPALVAMCGWNYISDFTSFIPKINFIGGLLLWGIVAMTIYITKKKKFIVSFRPEQELTEEELQKIVSKIKTQSIHAKYSDKFPMSSCTMPNKTSENISEKKEDNSQEIKKD
ncbi:hypothetical protein KBA27_02140 [bacterium]|nr:hypothetical protein [bacterium]